ncbi:MAG: CPBP family intramembrane metalloprotease [Saprospiraceae bacterium]|nr:CPBP family intramembrane metalloprotease [Saprospiraceae bacterium]MBP6568833.1 CPBP family intramembrane metalloprotease [Saprospiraceae bacterium]
MEFNWFDHILALFLVIILPLMSIKSDKISQELIESLPPKKHLFYTNGLMLIIGALLVLTSWNVSERQWTELGISFPVLSGNVLILTAVLVFVYLLDIIYGRFNQKYQNERLQEMSYVIPANWKEYRHYIFLAFAAGISEEVIFRSFLITYLSHFLSIVQYGDFLSVLIPAVVFSLSHLYQGWWAVFKIMVIAILLGFIFLLSGSLLIVVIIHVLIDLISGMMGVFGQAEQPSDEI